MKTVVQPFTVTPSATSWAERRTYRGNHRSKSGVRWSPRGAARARHAKATMWSNPLNWLRATVAGAEEALVSSGLAFVGLAGLSSGPEAPSGTSVVLWTLAAGGAGHIISDINARSIERDAEKFHDPQLNGTGVKPHEVLHDHAGEDHHHHDEDPPNATVGEHKSEPDHHHGHSHGYVHKSLTVTSLSSSASYAVGTIGPAAAHLVSGGGAVSAMAATGAGLFALGAFVSRYTKRGAVRTGVQVFLSGAIAMGATFLATAATAGNGWWNKATSAMASAGQTITNAASHLAANPTTTAAVGVSLVSTALAVRMGQRLRAAVPAQRSSEQADRVSLRS